MYKNNYDCLLNLKQKKFFMISIIISIIIILITIYFFFIKYQILSDMIN